MQKFHKNSIGTVVRALALFSLLSSIGPASVLAATSPSLGAAQSYSVLSGAGATNGGAGVTTIGGDLGVFPAASYSDVGTTVFLTPLNPHLADTSAQNAQIAQKAVFDGPLDFVAQPCTVTYAVTTELSLVGPLNPGVYCTDPGQDFTLSGTLTLNGTGSPATDVWIFRSSRDLIGSGTANVVFTGTGGSACNVWWRIANTATFTAGNTMLGNILAATSITFGQSATLDGRAFAFSGAVTMLGNTITGPTCALPATLHVVKQVVNNNAGVATSSDFSLHVKLSGVDVVGSPAVGSIAPGTPYILSPNTYVVSEDANILYTQSFSGDCDASGNITLAPGDDKTCTISNTDIPPPTPPSPAPPSTNSARREANLVSLSQASTSTPAALSVTSEVLGTSTAPVLFVYVPSIPNTGEGGQAHENLDILLLSITLVVIGLSLTINRRISSS